MDYEKIITGFNQYDTFSKRNGIRLIKLEKGYAEAELVVSPDTLNILGIIHGGALFTLADIAGGMAVTSHGYKCVTLNSDIHYIRAVSSGVAKAYAKEIHHGSKTAISEVTITNEKGDLLCACTATMFITGEPISFDK